MTVVVTMHDGSAFMLSRNLWAEKVVEQINAARGLGKLIALETDRTPTGQMVHLDPDLVQSVRDDR
jgi:hypothetical protein